MVESYANAVKKSLEAMYAGKVRLDRMKLAALCVLCHCKTKMLDQCSELMQRKGIHYEIAALLFLQRSRCSRRTSHAIHAFARPPLEFIIELLGTSVDGIPMHFSDILCCSIWYAGNVDIWQTAESIVPTSRIDSKHIAEFHLWSHPFGINSS